MNAVTNFPNQTRLWLFVLVFYEFLPPPDTAAEKRTLLRRVSRVASTENSSPCP